MAKTALIADDVEFVRKTLSEILTQAGYEVVAMAQNGQEAIDLYEKFKPDFITMDVVMPKMSGIEATRHLMRLYPHACIVIVSAMGKENLVMEAIHAGAKDYLLKPFTVDEVVKTLERVLASAPSNAKSSGRSLQNL